MFALEKCFGEGGTVHRNKWLLRSRAIAVNCQCDQFLASPGFSRDEDGRGSGSNARDSFPDILDRLAFPIDLGRSFQTNDSIFQQDVFAQEPGTFARPSNRGSHDLRLEWFCEKVECALAHALDRHFDGCHGGKKNHGNGFVGFVRGRENGQAFSIRHALVGDDYIKIIDGETALRLLHAFSFQDFVLVLAKVRRENAAHARFVIHQKDPTHEWSPISQPPVRSQARSKRSKFVAGHSP